MQCFVPFVLGLNIFLFCLCLIIYSLTVAGRAEGELYEDEGEGFAYQKGDYLLTHYEAALVSGELAKNGGEVVVRIAKSEGQRQRPKRTLHVRLLVGDTTQVLFPALLLCPHSRLCGGFSLAYSVLTLRTLIVGFEQVEGECLDGEELRLKVPSAAVINEIVTANHKQETSKLGA